MARLPIPGGDDNVWGNLLNDFLAVEHQADGSLKARTDGSMYTKPGTGVPASDLSAGVQSSLAKADAAVAKGSLLFDVKDYGATGNGTADDTTSINAAAAAATAAHGTLFFPPGTFMTTGITISNTNSFAIAGSGPGSVLKLLAGNSANVLQLNTCTKFSISDMTFDGNRSVQSFGTDEDLQCAVHIVSCSGFLVSGVQALDTHMSGIRLGLFPHNTGGCVDGAITNCYVNLGIDADQGIGVWNSERISVTNCVVQRGGWGGIVLTRSDHCTVTGNTSFDNTYTIAGGGGHGIALEGARFSTVSGNACYGNEYYGIHLEVDPQTAARYVEGCTISGNTCHSNDRGIFLGKSISNNINSNNVSNNTFTGIEITVDASHCVLDGNVIENNGEQGVWIKGDDCLASNNAVKDNTTEGILVDGTLRTSLLGNHVFSNTNAGIDLRGIDRFVVTNNLVENNAQGILVQKSGPTPCRDGSVSNNTSYANGNEGVIAIGTETTTFSANSISGNANGGFSLRGIQYCTINGNSVMNNGTTLAHKFGIQLVDEGGQGCLANTFTGNNSSDNQNTPTQTRGIEELGAADRNVYLGNICRNNIDGQISTVGANDVIANNITA
jgi:parallel beta-helix repeat protein